MALQQAVGRQQPSVEIVLDDDIEEVFEEHMRMSSFTFNRSFKGSIVKSDIELTTASIYNTKGDAIHGSVLSPIRITNSISVQ